MKFFYIPMTYEEAAKELDQAGINAKLLSGETARKILEESLTPTQAQAVLMTAWGQILKNARFTLPDQREN